MAAMGKLLWRVAMVGPNVVALGGLALIGAGKLWQNPALVRVGLYALVPAAVAGIIGIVFALTVLLTRVVMLYRSRRTPRAAPLQSPNAGSDSIDPIR